MGFLCVGQPSAVQQPMPAKNYKRIRLVALAAVVLLYRKVRLDSRNIAQAWPAGSTWP